MSNNTSPISGSFRQRQKEFASNANPLRKSVYREIMRKKKKSFDPFAL